VTRAGRTFAGIHRQLLYRQCSEPTGHTAPVDGAARARETVHTRKSTSTTSVDVLLLSDTYLLNAE
jgi:hypothetical protein